MGTWLASLLPWGTEWIQWVQGFHHPILHIFFRTITVLGNELGYVLLLPLIYWCIDARSGRRLGILIFTSLSINSLCKGLFQLPRPGAEKVKVLVHESSHSFPSGHAQGTLTMWGYLSWVSGKRWFQLLTLFLVLSIGLSRIYLGAHFPQDILGGWVLALLCLFGFFWLEPRLSPRLLSMPLWAQLLPATLLPLGLFLLSPDRHHTASCASLLGFSVGLVVERRFLRFSSDGTNGQRALRYLAVLLLGGLLFFLKWLFPPDLHWRFLRYTLVSFSAAWLIPWLFVRLGMAGTEQSTPGG